MENLTKILKTPFRFRLPPVLIFSFTLFYSYILTESKGPGRESGAALLILFFIWITPKLYKDDLFELNRPLWEYLSVCLFFIIALVSYLPVINFSITADELWHSYMANFILAKISRIVMEWAPLTVESVRENPWSRWDPRVLPAMDVWRLLTFPILFLVFGIAYYLKWAWKLSVEKRNAAIALFLAVSVLVSVRLHTNVDPHPPLRLFPWLLSQFAFGLNDWGLRLTGPIFWSLTAGWIFIFLKSRKTSVYLSFLAACMTLFVPQAYYAIQIVEPSFYGYSVWLVVLILAARFLVDHDEDDLIRIGTIIGVGTLLRQPAIVLWILPFCLLITHSRLRQKPELWLAVFLPMILSLHYFSTVKYVGHSVAGIGSPFEKLHLLLTDGHALAAILNSTTWPWIVFTLLIVSLLAWNRRREALIFLALPVCGIGYLMMVHPGLWTSGRYQAEYIAAFIAFGMITVAQVLKAHKLQSFFSIACVLLAFTTVEIDRNLSLDILNNGGYDFRVTTSLNYPFRDAFKYMKQQDIGDRFVFLGGGFNVAHMNLWMSGFSLVDSDNSVKRQEKFEEELSKIGLLQSLKKQAPVDYLLVLTGSRAERIHRAENIKKAYSDLDELITANCLLKLEKSFGPEHGSYIDVYKIANRPCL